MVFVTRRSGLRMSFLTKLRNDLVLSNDVW